MLGDNPVHPTTTLDIAGTVVVVAAAWFLGSPARWAADLAHLSFLRSVGVGKTIVEHAVRATFASVRADPQPTQFIAVAGLPDGGALGNTGPAGSRLWRRQFEMNGFASRGKQQCHQCQ